MTAFNKQHYEEKIVPQIRDLYLSQQVADAFLRYGLDLQEDDTAKIKAQVAAVHQYWALKTSHPRDGLMYKNLHEDTRVRQDLESGGDSRTRLRFAARGDREARERERMQELTSAINVAAAEGYLTPKAVATLVATQVKLGFNEKVVRSLLADIAIREVPAAVPMEPGLDTGAMKNIDAALTTLGVANLYAFMGLSRGASVDVWKARYKDVMEKSRIMGAGPRAQATNTLIGFVKSSLLSDPGAYAKAVDYRLALKLEPHVKQLGSEGAIGELGYNRLVAAALASGLKTGEAEKAVKWLAQKNSITVAAPSAESAESASLCPHCHTVIRGGERLDRCPHCNAARWTKCPECGGRTLVGEPCSLCGYPLPRSMQIEQLLQLGKAKLRANDLTEALLCLADLEKLWRGGHAAQLRKDVEAARERVESGCREFHTALDGHEPYRAKGLLDQLRSVGAGYEFRDGSTLSSMEGAVGSVMKRVEVTLSSARAALSARKTDEAVVLFERVLEQAKDSQEARKGLSGCVPEPPTQLRTRQLATSVMLEWNASTSRGTLEYGVGWSEDRAPRTEADGTISAPVAGLAWEDKTLGAGVRRFYSVFTRRGDARSAPLSSAAVMGRFEVKNLSITGVDNLVVGKWDALPNGAKALVSRRTVTPPAAGEREIASGPAGFSDEAVSAGAEYEYRVAVEYAGAGGKSAGVTARVQVEQALHPVTELRIERNAAGASEIRWKSPPVGRVMLFALRQAPAQLPGTPMDMYEITACSQYRIRFTGNSVVWTRPSVEPAFITAVTVLNDHGVMGPWLLDVEDVSGVTGLRGEDSIGVMWAWPAGCTSARVCWRTDHFASSANEGGTQTLDITRGRYDVDRGFKLPNPQAKNYYLTVLAGYFVGGNTQYAGGSSPGARLTVSGERRHVVRYSIKKLLFQRGKFTLSIELDTPNAVLPELKLVSRPGGAMPLRIQDGELIYHVRSKGSPFKVDFDLPQKGFLRLLLVKSTDRDRYEVVDPQPKEMDWTR